MFQFIFMLVICCLLCGFDKKIIIWDKIKLGYFFVFGLYRVRSDSNNWRYIYDVDVYFIYIIDLLKFFKYFLYINGLFYLVGGF